MTRRLTPDLRPSYAFAAILTTLLAAPSALAVGQPQAGSVEAGTLSLPPGPSSVRGLSDDATVNVFTGQAAYRIALDLPAGPGGFRPTLALRYEGAMGNGPLGVGWSMTVPHIRRDTRLGVPNYQAANGPYEIIGVGGGGSLIAAGDGSYRIEGNGNRVKVEFFANAAGTPTVARATDGDGVVYFMGSTPAGRQRDGQRIYAWFTQFVLYPSGQSISLQYSSDAGQIYLTRMSWGPAGALALNLGYQNRPDPVATYRPGFKVQTNQRLQDAEVESFGSVLRRYELSYDEALPLSRIAAVTQRGRGGQGQLPISSFTYGPLQPPATVTMPGTGSWSLNDPNVTLLDIDGDGLADLVRFAPGGHSYRRNLGDQFAAVQPLPSDLPGAQPELAVVRLMDMQGNARPELVRVHNQSWQVMQLNNNAWSTIGTWSGTHNMSLGSPAYAFADVNGDQRTDVLLAAAAGLEVRLNSPSQELLPGTYAGPVSPTANLVPGQMGVSFRDMNGDGLADAVQKQLSQVDIYPGRGDGTFDAPYALPYPTGITVSDPAAQVRLADLNRDGVTDLIVVAAGNVMGYLARPDGSLWNHFSIPRPELANPGQSLLDVRVALVDANGNGSTDVVWSSPRGFWVLDLAGSTSAGMLTLIENGLGQSMRFDYSASTRLALADELDPQQPAWSERLPVSIPVPTQVTVALASGEADRVTRYRVRDGFWDVSEHRFGGFLVGTRIFEGDTTTDTLVQRSHFLAGLGAQRVLRGSAWRVDELSGSGILLRRRETDWLAHPIASLPASNPRLRVPVATERRTLHFEGGSTPVTTRQRFNYDGDGNQSTEYRDGRLDRPEPTLRISRSFAHNNTTWVRNRLIEEQAVDDTGKLMWHTRTYYDGGATPLAHGQLDRGWPRKVEAYDDGSRRWLTQQATDYDAAGNGVRHYRDGVWRDFAYDRNQLHPVSETLSPSPGQSLTWSASWDPVLGRPLAISDPNGVTHEIRYDDLGRPTSIGLAGKTAHTRYAYRWNAPRPETETTFFDGAAGKRSTVAVHNSRGETLYEAQSMGRSAWIISDYTQRDARGQVAFVAEPFAWNATALPTALPTRQAGQSTQRDALARPVVQSLANGSTRTTTYQPLAYIVATTALSPASFELNGQGRVTHAERTVSGTREHAQSSYDAAGRLLAHSLMGGQAMHRFSYDSMGRLTRAEDSDSGKRAYEYDEHNRLIKQLNGDGQSIRYHYDNAGRLTSASGSDGTAYTYYYDQPPTGNAASFRTRARLAWVDEPQGTTVLRYDDFGRIAYRQRKVAGKSATESRAYSPSGLLLWARFDDGFRADYSYDAAGRLSAIKPYWQALDIDAGGRVRREEYGNGIVQEYDLDVLGRPTTVRVLRGTIALLDLSLARTAFGAPYSVNDRDGVGHDHSASYSFDGAARIVGASIGGYNFSYAYDGLQNLSARSVSGSPSLKILTGSYQYGSRSGPRQLASVGSISFDYDGAGRMTRSDRSLLTYNAFDRVMQVDAPNGKIDYDYGHDGLRVYTRDSRGNEERRFSPDDVRDSTGTRRHYLKVGQRLVARIDIANTSSERFFHVGVGAGPALITDSTGQLLDERVCEPFGMPIAGGNTADEHGWGNKPVDANTGWSDHGARWLAPETTRWHSPDPIVLIPDTRFAADPWGLHPYQYVRNNPTIYWDPDGRQEKPYLPGINAPLGPVDSEPLPETTPEPGLIKRALNWLSGRVKTKTQVAIKKDPVKFKTTGEEHGLDASWGPLTAGASRKKNGNAAAKLELGRKQKLGDRAEAKGALGTEFELDPDTRDFSLGKLEVYAKGSGSLKAGPVSIEAEVKATIAKWRVRLRNLSEGLMKRHDALTEAGGEVPQYYWDRVHKADQQSAAQ